MKKILLATLLTIISLQAKENSLRGDILVGSLVGAAEATFPGQPLIYRMNMRLNKWPLSKNPLHWYKGVGTNVGLMAPITALQVGLDGTLRRALKSHPNEELGTIQKAGTAFAAGATGGIIAVVQEMVPLYQQMVNKDLIKYARKMKFSEAETTAYLKKHGISTMDAIKQLRMRIFNGLGAIAIRDGKFSCGYIAVYEALKQKLQPNTNTEKAILGTAVGLGTAAVSQPLQVIKSKKQGEMAQIAQLEYTGKKVPNTLLTSSRYWNIFLNTVQEEGFKGLFKALPERSIRVVATAILYALLEEKILESISE